MTIMVASKTPSNCRGLVAGGSQFEAAITQSAN